MEGDRSARAVDAPSTDTDRGAARSARGCQPEARGFKSRRVRHQVLEPEHAVPWAHGGPGPLGRIAQLAERAPEKREVTGSTPVPTTRIWFPDLSPSHRPGCRARSRRGPPPEPRPQRAPSAACRVLVTGLLTVLTLLVGARPAGAHSELIDSDPAPATVLDGTRSRSCCASAGRSRSTPHPCASTAPRAPGSTPAGPSIPTATAVPSPPPSPTWTTAPRRHLARRLGRRTTRPRRLHLPHRHRWHRARRVARRTAPGRRGRRHDRRLRVRSGPIRRVRRARRARRRGRGHRVPAPGPPPRDPTPAAHGMVRRGAGDHGRDRAPGADAAARPLGDALRWSVGGDVLGTRFAAPRWPGSSPCSSRHPSSCS